MEGTIVEHIEGFCGLGEDLVGLMGVGMLECWVVVECDIAIAALRGWYLVQICWRVQFLSTPKIW